MAEAILRQIAGDEYIAYSAGTQPRGVHPRTIEVMDEIDVDIRQQKSKKSICSSINNLISSSRFVIGRRNGALPFREPL